MKRTVIIAATIAAFGAITVAPLAAKSGGPRAGTSTSQGSSGVGKIDAKPRINKSIGLRFHCYRVPHQDKLGIVIVKRECVTG